MDLFENAGTVCSAPKAYMQGMPEIVQKAHILEARANAPCADQGIGNDAVALQSVDVRAGKGIGKARYAKVVHQVGQTLRAIAKIIVIAGGIPAVNAGNTPIGAIFHQKSAHPSLAVQGVVIAPGR